MFDWKPRGSFILCTLKQCELISLFSGSSRKFLKSSGLTGADRLGSKRREAKVRGWLLPQVNSQEMSSTGKHLSAGH